MKNDRARRGDGSGRDPTLDYWSIIFACLPDAG
jgi:hypothetical protein